MSDNKKYYYLKSLKINGQLRFTAAILYDENIISTITNMNIDIVRVGIKILMELQFIEKLDDGTLFMSEIQNFIGRSSTEADRVRAYRNEINDVKLLAVTNVQQTNDICTKNDLGTNVAQMYDKSTPEKELDIDLDIEKQKQHKIPDKIHPVKSQNKKNFKNEVVVGEETNVKVISEYYVRLTKRYVNHKDTSAMGEILDHPIDLPMDYKSRVNIILDTMKRIYDDFQKKNPGEEIKSFKYFVTPIKNEFKKYTKDERGSKINEKGANTFNVNGGEPKFDFSNFADNK